jgi:thiol-disulfide isomerase/thioredoxin
MSRIAYLLVLTALLYSCSGKNGNETANTTSNETSYLIPITQEGVIFYANNVDKAFEMAKAQGKPIFLEVYSESCHVCQSFIPIFKEQKVSDFYNQNFLSYKIEVNSPEFQSFILGRKIFVPSLPLLLYLDENKNVVHLGVIEANSDKLIEQGKLALDPKQRAASMKQRFLGGEKSNQFLIDYAMFSRVTMDTAMNRKAMELYANQQPQSSYTTETNFVAIQKLLMDISNPMGTYFINNLPIYKKMYDPAIVKSVAENLVMSSLYSGFGSAYDSKTILQMRDYLVKSEIDPQVARNRVLLPLINAYFKEGTPARATDLVNNHTTQVPLKVTDYLYILRYFNEKSPDAGYASSAQNWFRNAMNMVQTNSTDEVELYYELAFAYKRANNKLEALKNAEKALSIARTTQAETVKIENLVRSL